MSSHSWRITASFFAALILISGCGGKSRLKVGAAPEGEVVEAVGEVMIDPNNLEDTKKRSLADAQKKAVEMVVGLHLSAKTMVEKSVLIQSNILARTEGYIRKYDIIKEWKDPPLYKTRIRAYVAYQQIADDLKALGLLKEPQLGYPRVAVVLTETAPDANLDPGTTPATDALTQALLDKGYRVVDRSALTANNALSVAQEIAQGNMSRAEQLGKAVDAEVLIFGSVQATLFQANGFGGLISYRATLFVKAYQAKTGEVLLTMSKTEPGLEGTTTTAAMKALAAAGQMAGTDIAQQLADQLAQRAFAEVTVTGVPDLNHLNDIEQAISMVPGAGDHYLRSFSNGEAHIEVQLESVSAGDIASSLEKNAALKLKVQGVTQNTIQAQQQP
jgi:hypothetical protein